MTGTEVVIEWEYWPKGVKGTVGDPIPGKDTMKNMIEAVNRTVALMTAHGENLRYVTATVRLA